MYIELNCYDFVGFVNGLNGCRNPCGESSSCAGLTTLLCDSPGCVKECRSNCCRCVCPGNEKTQINV